MTDNLQLWDDVSKTDPSATKQAKVNGQNISSIDGYWVIQQATRVFGPLGIGWGYDILEERLDEGQPFQIKLDDGSFYNLIAQTHTIKLKLWYKFNGEKGEIIQYGHTKAVYKSSYGVSDDTEAPKKSLMDAIKKSLSMLGFCADVFMGMHEDVNYLNQLIAEEAIKNAEDKDAEIAARRQEIIDYVKSNKNAIDTSKSVNEVKGITKVALLHLSRQKLIHSIADLCEKGINELSIVSEKKLTVMKNDSAT